MMRNARSLVALSLVACITIVPRLCHAFSVTYCDGQVINWPSVRAMARVACSFPAGTDGYWAYNNAGWQDWQIANVLDWNYVRNDCNAAYGDGWNNTFLQTPDQLSNANGLTTCQLSSCGFGRHSHINECDIAIRNDMSFAPQDESFWKWDDTGGNLQQGRSVLIHEWGHAIGLNHVASGLDLLRGPPGGTYQKKPLAGGNTSELYPDQANGARFLYPGSYSVNLFSSAQMLDSYGSIVATGASETYNVYYPGTPLSIWVTVANNGAQYESSGFRLFIKSTPPPSDNSGGYTLLTGTAINPAGTYFSQRLNVVSPAVPPGLYWIYWAVDTGNTVSEFNESDNVVHSASTLWIH